MKLFVCCLFLCAVGIISQAQSQDLPEVAAAKAAHFEAVRRAELIIANAPPVSHHPKPAVVETTQHKLGLNVHDTPEVAAAKTAHYEALRDAQHATSVANATGKVPDSKPIGAISPVHYPAPVHYSAPAVHHYNSAPVVQTTQHQLGVNVHDTPEVAAAKAIHNEAVRRAQQTSGAVSYDHSNTHYSAPTVHHYKSAPVMETNQHQLGVSVHDTPEVAAAKAAHFEALRRAEMTAGPHTVDQYSPKAHQVMYMAVPYHQSLDYNHMVVAVPQTNQHKLGVNVHDTPEVAAAKAAHYKAVRNAEYATYVANATGRVPDSRPIGTITVPFAQPSAPVHYPAAVHHYNSAPVIPTTQHQLGVNVHDTPEVAAAKAAHFEALRRAEMTAGPHTVDQYTPKAHQVMYMAVPYHRSLDYSHKVVAVPQTNQHKLGVNVHDTPEVADAKNAHFEAFRQAQLVAANKHEFPANNYFANPASDYGQVY